MKRNLLIIYLLISTVSFSQSLEIRKEIDSLKYAIAIAKHDSLKIKSYIAWQNLIFEADPELDFKLNQRITEICLINLQKSISVKEKIYFKKELGNTYNIFGTYFETKGNYPKAIEYLNLSLKIAEDIGNLYGIANAYNNLGNCYRHIEDYKRTIYYYEKAVVYWQIINDEYGMGLTLNNLGSTYTTLEEYDKSESYLKEAKKIFLKLDEKAGLGLALHNLGQLFYHQNALDSSIVYFQKSLELYREIGNKKQIASNLRRISEIYFDEALLLKKLGDQNKYQLKLNEAFELAQESVTFSENSNSLEEFRSTLQNLYLIEKEKETY